MTLVSAAQPALRADLHIATSATGYGGRRRESLGRPGSAQGQGPFDDG